MTTQLINDGSYYFKDGNCIFQVENNAFKVHRHLFIQESPIFSNLLVQSQGAGLNNTWMAADNSKEGKPEDILMIEESLESFRALCWALYANPIEIREQRNPDTVDIYRLVTLALITHKYKFNLLEKWSIDVLRKHWMADFASKAVPATHPIQWNVDIIEQLVVFSTKTTAIDLVFKRSIENQWFLHNIANTEGPSGVQRALRFTDGLSSGRLSGLAHYHALRRLGLFNQEHPGQGQGGSPVIEPGTFRNYNNLGGMLSEFDPHYRSRLVRGFWCLMLLRGENSLRGLQNGHVRCISAWRTAFLDSSPDFGAALEKGLRQLKFSNGNLCDSCREFLQSHLQTLFVAFEENLINYFIPLK